MDKIVGIYKESWGVNVGTDGITQIIEDDEHGHMAVIKVYKVYRGKHLFLKVYPHGHIIEYNAPKPKVDLPF